MMGTTQHAAASRLALGTAQFGYDYGISNQLGRVPREEVALILREAFESGVRTLDTAENYGQSESTIGDVLDQQPLAFEVVTKFPGSVKDDSLGMHLAESLKRLHIESLYGYLAHDPASLLDEKLVEILRQAQAAGLIDRFGASVYHPRQVEQYLELGIDLGLIQIPYSAVDQRFSALLPELQKRNIRVHARSAFLQGLLLMKPDGSRVVWPPSSPPSSP